DMCQLSAGFMVLTAPHDEFTGADMNSPLDERPMMPDFRPLRLAATICLMALGSGSNVYAQEASRWDGDARSAARLIAGSPAAGEGTLHAGIEIRLKPGWHTYWRYPGDAGVPPQF